MTSSCNRLLFLTEVSVVATEIEFIWIKKRIKFLFDEVFSSILLWCINTFQRIYQNLLKLHKWGRYIGSKLCKSSPKNMVLCLCFSQFCEEDESIFFPILHRIWMVQSPPLFHTWLHTCLLFNTKMGAFESFKGNPIRISTVIVKLLWK